MKAAALLETLSRGTTRIRWTLALLEEALGQSDLRPAFEAIAAKS